MGTENSSTHPLWALSEGDLELVLRLVLASGSLKELAQMYGVSYPTIRSRLDGLIERLKAVLEKQPLDPMARALNDLVSQGEIPAKTAQHLLELHRNQLHRKATVVEPPPPLKGRSRATSSN